MHSDLWYFYESDLNRGCLIKFYNSLPSHLMEMFKDSMGGFSFCDKDGANVLQGYRGPHNNGDSGDSEYLGASNGLQEVKYWWGVSKHLNWIPIGGWISYGFARIGGDTAWHSLYFDSKTGECLSHNKNQAAEKLNNKGLQLLQEKNYSEAAEYFNNAYLNCSSGYHNEQTFQNRRDQARNEIEAIRLNAQGDDSFNQGDFEAAYKKYEEAYDKSQVCDQFKIYKTNKEKAQNEADAINLNAKGDELFNQGKYDEAHKKYQNACDKSRVSNRKNLYIFIRIKAQNEKEALNLNSQGNELFKQGKYDKAHEKYHKAYEKSQVRDNHKIYKTNKEKAQNEIDAINLNSQGNKLFGQSKYKEAQIKYQEAHNKSNIEKAKDIYAKKQIKTQTVINKLTKIETLWSNAWRAENCAEEDKSKEAKECFQKVLKEAKDGSEIVPNNTKFKQYETLVILKIEGNELFNQGLESQQIGINLLNEAQELKQRKKFELATGKFKEAKHKFSEAIDKFKTGSEIDQRFFLCIEFVQEHLDQVEQSIDMTESHVIAGQRLKDLNISIRNDGKDTTNNDKSNVEVKDELHNYYKQI